MKREAIVVVLIGIYFLPLAASTQAQVSFFQPPSYAGTGANTFFADFNGDGKIDILAADGTMNLGNGDGTFKLGTPVSGSVLAVADFNGDGKPDLLEQGTGTLLVLLGNGDGTFRAPISTASGANLSVVAAGDLNGDSEADVVGVFNNTLLVYLSKGDGTFATGVSYTIGTTTLGETGITLGDFNGDHVIDIAVTNGGAAQEVVFLGKGDGTFQGAMSSTGSSHLACAVAGDFNGDGKLDLALGCFVNAPDQGEVYILLGNGDGTFQTPVAAFAGNGPIAAADVNGDGKLDLVLQEEEPNGPQTTVAQIYLGNGNATFSNSSNYILGIPTSGTTLPSFGVGIVDLNSDGKLDFAAGNTVLLGNGEGTFQGIQYAPGNAGAFVIGTFEKSGAPGLASAVRGVTVYKNNGSGLLSLVESYPIQGSSGSEGIVTADFNGDGYLDLLVSFVDPVSFLWSYSVLLGNGDGSFQAPVYYPQVSAIRENVSSVLAADFRNDQKTDVAIAGVDSQSLELLLGNGDGTFAAPVGVFDNGEFSLVSADFNGDGKLDIAAGTSGSGTAILIGNGDGTFQAAVFPTNLNNFGVLFTADLNSDGKPDLISNNQVALANGDGTFTVLPVLTGLSILSIGDLNGDGRPDLIVLNNSSSNLGVLLGNGDGTFGSFINVLPTAVPISAVSNADMNADGRTDLVFPWGKGYGVLLNTTAAGFEVFASAISPAAVTGGNSATSTVSIIPTFGFNSSVALSCAGLPTGVSCGFNPPTIASSSGTSTLTITTAASTAAGTYSVQVQGGAGSILNSSALSLVVQAAPDFSVTGTPMSQTVSAGQTASFNLSLVGSGTFSGTVNLSCAVTPAVTEGPVCSLSSSSEQISGTTAQSVTVTVGTTAPSNTAVVLPIALPPGLLPLGWTLACTTMLGITWWALRSRKRAPILVVPVLMLVVLTWVACGGSGSSSSHNTQGTPPGTYTATITASSGSLSHTQPLQVIVQ
jgi:FG-GAP-like repeat